MEELLKLTLSPAFEPTTTIRLEREPGQGGRATYRVTHKESRSYRADVERRRFGLPADIAEEILRELDSVDTDARQEEACDLDGTTTRIKFRRGLNTVMLSWLGDVPREWANLSRVITLLEQPPESTTDQ